MRPTKYNRNAHRTMPKARDYDCDLCAREGKAVPAVHFRGNYDRGVYHGYCQPCTDAVDADNARRGR